MSERFYLPASGQPGQVEIDGPEASHISKVMRLDVGDTVWLFNGEGLECSGTIATLARNRVTVDVTEWTAVSRESDRFISVVVCPPKGDRLKFMVEKLTELGVDELVPLITSRSTVIPKSNTIEKMRRYVIEASKQCRRNRLMRICEPTKLESLATQASEIPHRLVCHPTGDKTLSERLTVAGEAEPIQFLIGPEGGFTDPELETVTDAKWELATMGPRILRTETAALTCVARAQSGF